MTTTPLLPPHSTESEQATIGSMLMSAEAIDKAMMILHEWDFYHERHRTLFRAITDMRRQHKPCDTINVVEVLTSRKQFEEIGGMSYLLEIQEQPIFAAITHYAQTVRDHAIRRRMIAESDRLRDTAYNTEVPVLSALSQAESSLSQIAEVAQPKSATESLSDITVRVIKNIAETVSRGESRGLMAPWRGLSTKHMLRPICPGQMVVIAARPAMGKSAFLLNWCLGWAKAGHAGQMFSLEMENEETTLRAMLGHMAYTQDHVDDLEFLLAHHADVLADLGNASAELDGVPFYLNDRQDMTVNHMRNELKLTQKRLRKEFGPDKKLEWVGADFMQLIPPDVKSRNKADEIGSVAYALAGLAKDFHTRVICLAQLNRECEDNGCKRPNNMRFLEGSGRIEQAAHRILYIYRPSIYGPEECAAASKDGLYTFPEQDELNAFTEIGVLKQRGGVPNGKAVLYYDGPRYTFRDLTREEIAIVRGTR